jgi:hypothetical protein
MLRDVTDPMDRWWTKAQAAEHLDATPRTIQRYIEGGLPVHFPHILGGFLDRDELLAVVRNRAERKNATRGKKTSA